jgi:uncharacterized membrane protein
MISIPRLIKKHSRLVVSFVLGIVASLLAPLPWHGLLRLLLGWNVMVWFYLLLAFWLMLHATSTKVAQLAEQEDEADIAIIVIMSIAAAVSLGAIVFELSTVREITTVQKFLRYGITIATVLGSWCFVAIIFTFHYARLYYRSPTQQRALVFYDVGLQPNYWDFLYFSFTIAVAFQTSDITLSSRTVRKAALAQSVLSFWFNIAILGLSINIAAGLISSS